MNTSAAAPVARPALSTPRPSAAAHRADNTHVPAPVLLRKNAHPTDPPSYAQLKAEITQLHEALSSRSTIEQAKGIVRARQPCANPDEAFEALVRLSQDTNVKLREVAAALVYQATGSNRRAS